MNEVCERESERDRDRDREGERRGAGGRERVVLGLLWGGEVRLDSP